MTTKSQSLIKLKFKNKTNRGKRSIVMPVDPKIKLKELKVTLGHIFDLHPESFTLWIKGETSEGELEEEEQIQDYDLNQGDTLLITYKRRNVKISKKAWEMLRKAKYNLRERSYSSTIKDLNSNIKKARSTLLNAAIKDFNEKEHRVKVPSDRGENQGSKTILLDDEAIRILERIKIESNKSGFTYSDAIDFLVSENDLI